MVVSEDKSVIILDGASGTMMQQRGLPTGVCPELWAMEHEEILKSVQQEYVEAGSDMIYTFTFGGNRLKLEEYGLGDRTYEINKALAKISKEVAGEKVKVVGDLAPTGVYMRPTGDYGFEDIVEAYKEQVRGLLDGGVDLFVIETMMDINEARAALLAVKETCDLPCMVSMTFEESGRTLTGTDPVTALLTLQSMGADVVGCNCSTGPEAMVKVLKKMAPYATVPLMAKPNAGLPKLVDGETHFSMGVTEYSIHATSLIGAGASIIGGCCGTTPQYIQSVKEKVKELETKGIVGKPISVLTSSRKFHLIEQEGAFSVVGERINPTGKKQLQKDLLKGDLGTVLKFAKEQEEKGASVLDVNVGMNGIDEKEMMLKTIEVLSTATALPLCIDSSNPEVIEAALRIYPGRALLNSITLEAHKVNQLLKAASKYGAMFIALPLEEGGLPANLEEKHRIVEDLVGLAEKHGMTRADIVVDGLVMTVSSNQQAVKETLATIQWCSQELGVNTIIGLSNVSFGLPERKFINGAFMAMAMDRGLTMAIANPAHELLMASKMAAEVLTGKDVHCRRYIGAYGGTNKDETGEGTKKASKGADKKELKELLFESVVEGEEQLIEGYIQRALDEDKEPGWIVDECLIPGINKVGQLFDSQIYFLPQLILSAETMKRGFTLLEPMLLKANEGAQCKPKIIIATVKGDIHDIGKNIVGLMLKNYGFDVIDLGKDVDVTTIVEAVKSHHVHVVGLSALMTTTMVYMKDVIDALKAESLDVKVMIGGAVITPEYAEEIGADGYSKDANEAVGLAMRLIEPYTSK